MPHLTGYNGSITSSTTPFLLPRPTTRCTWRCHEPIFRCPDSSAVSNGVKDAPNLALLALQVSEVSVENKTLALSHHLITTALISEKETCSNQLLVHVLLWRMHKESTTMCDSLHRSCLSTRVRDWPECCLGSATAYEAELSTNARLFPGWPLHSVCCSKFLPFCGQLVLSLRALTRQGWQKWLSWEFRSTETPHTRRDDPATRDNTNPLHSAPRHESGSGKEICWCLNFAQREICHAQTDLIFNPQLSKVIAILIIKILKKFGSSNIRNSQ